MFLPNQTAYSCRLIALMALLLLGCDSLLRISGKVVDTRGKPIASARVWLIYGDWVAETQTSADGAFTLGRTHGPNGAVSLLVSKDGKQLYYRIIDSHIPKTPMEIVLKDGSQMEINTPSYP